jgi:hypothetical protein
MSRKRQGICTVNFNKYDSRSPAAWFAFPSVFLSFPSPSVFSPLSPFAAAHAMQRGAAGVPPRARLCSPLHRRLVSCFALHRFLCVTWRGEFQCSQVVSGQHDSRPLPGRFQRPPCENLLQVVVRPHPSHLAWVPSACPCCQKPTDHFVYLVYFYCSLD